MERPELRNPFSNCKLVGANVDSHAYHLQVEGITRGNPQFVLSRSELMLFNHNPQNWLAGYKPKDTDATDWGSLIDCLVTDRGRFDERYVIPPEFCTATKTMGIVRSGEAQVGDQVPWNPQCKECKDWKEEQERIGLAVIDAEEMLEATSAVARLMKDPVAAPFLQCSAKQVMCVGEYADKETGLVVPVKILIDLVPAHDHPEFGGDLGDFKTARDASPDEWRKVVPKRHYDAQAAMNLDVYNLATGEQRFQFRHVIQENVAPYQPARRLLSAERVNIGRGKVIGALRFYCQCLKSGVWPSWDDSVDPIYKGWGIVEPTDWEMTH